MVTLKQVAKLAGVHASVVSRVISEDKTLNIKPSTRERILEAIKELNYKPNISAQNLKRGHSKIIGLIVPDFNNPVYSDIIHGVEDQAIAEGYGLMIYSSKQKGLQNDYFSHLTEGRVDGLIIASSEFEDQKLKQLEKDGRPFVLVNRYADNVSEYVVSDDIGGAKMAVEYLISKGHQKIAHISGPSSTGTGLNRVKGYKLALEEANLDYHPEYVLESSYTIEGGYKKTQELLKLENQPTAIFAANVMICLGAMKALRDHNKKIPEDMSIIGVHDVFFSSTLNPPLTTVQLPLYQMGQNAVKKLIGILERNEHTPGEVLDYKKLIERESVLNLNLNSNIEVAGN